MNSVAPNDLEIKRAQKDDLTALNEVLSKSAPYIFSLCKSWCRPPIEVEDVAQESLIQIAKNIKSFKGSSAFFSWVYTLTYRTFLDQLRRETRRSKIAKMSPLSNENGLENTVARSDSLAENPELEALNAVGEALGLLENISSEVLILIDVQGNSYEQASKALGVPIGTVRSRLARARLNLKKILIEQGTFDTSGNVLFDEEQK